MPLVRGPVRQVKESTKPGAVAINKEVLKEFNKLKYPNVQCDRGSQYWHIVSGEKLAYIEEKAAMRKQRKEEIAKLKEESRL